MRETMKFVVRAELNSNATRYNLPCPYCGATVRFPRRQRRGRRSCETCRRILRLVYVDGSTTRFGGVFDVYGPKEESALTFQEERVRTIVCEEIQYHEKRRH